MTGARHSFSFSFSLSTFPLVSSESLVDSPLALLCAILRLNVALGSCGEATEVFVVGVAIGLVGLVAARPVARVVLSGGFEVVVELVLVCVAVVVVLDGCEVFVGGVTLVGFVVG